MVYFFGRWDSSKPIQIQIIQILIEWISQIFPIQNNLRIKNCTQHYHIEIPTIFSLLQ